MNRMRLIGVKNFHFGFAGLSEGESDQMSAKLGRMHKKLSYIFTLTIRKVENTSCISQKKGV